MGSYKTVFLVIGYLLAALAGGMLVPALVDVIMGETDWQVFIASALVTGFIAVALILSNSGRLPPLSAKQALLLTSWSWIILTGFAALPFAFTTAGQISYTDAFFEAMSGLTTTGATIMSGLDTSARGILLWRAILQWFGGIGIIVMAISVLPMLNVGGMQLFRLESSDTSEKILPRTAQIAGSITRLYLGISLLCALAYFIAGMSAFDAITHAMTTIATGGFSTHDASLGYFNSSSIELVGLFFMIASALPFVAYLQLMNRKVAQFRRDTQMRSFFVLAAGTITALWLYQIIRGVNPSDTALIRAAFNGVSILTGTGYATEDYTLWGPFATGLFFVLTFIGGCAGSTACGLKIFRLQVLLKAGWSYIQQIVAPHGVFVVRYNGRVLADDVIGSVMNFVSIYVLSFAAIALALSLMQLDTLTALSAAAAAIANVGPGLGAVVGPSGNYAALPDLAKWILSLGMLLGRLEFLAVLVMLSPSFWRR